MGTTNVDLLFLLCFVYEKCHIRWKARTASRVWCLHNPFEDALAGNIFVSALNPNKRLERLIDVDF